jgi:hypothetical protein
MFSGVQGHIPRPTPKTSLRVHGVHPLAQEVPLCPVLLRVLALRLQHQEIARLEPDQKIGPVLADDSSINCSPSEQVGQIGVIEEERVVGSS